MPAGRHPLLGWAAGLVVVVPVLAFVRTATVPVQMPGHDPSQCYCRAAGKRFSLGETACLETPAGLRIAECRMVLNVTSWAITSRPCPQA